MAKQRASSVLVTSTTTGTGSYSIAGVVTGYRNLSAIPGIADGDTLELYVEDVDANGVPTGAYEEGIYTWRTGNTLDRTSFVDTSNGGAAVSWTTGTRRIGLTLLAENYNPGVPIGALIALAYNSNNPTLGDMVFQKANTSVAYNSATHADPTLLPGYWTTYGVQKSVALGDFGSGAVQPTLMAGNGSGTVCAVGTSGIVTTTDNGANWTTLQGSFYSVVFANSKFVAVGDNGLVAYSSDGYAWTFIHAVNKTTSWRSVIWDTTNSLFIAVGICGVINGSVIMTSPDGVTWTSRLTFGTAANGFNKIIQGGGYQVAVGAAKVIYTATNGTTFTARTITGGGATQNFVDVAYSGSAWVAVGTFATGNYAYINSANPTGTWTAGNLGTTSLAINCITVFNSLFVVGVASSTAAGNIQTAAATDGSVWTSRTGVASPPVAMGSDGSTLIVMCVAVNNGCSSTDGATYTSRTITIGACGGTIGNGPIGSLTYLNGVMVETATYSASGNGIATVSMGATPTASGVYGDLSLNGTSGAGVNTYAAAYGAGVYVVVGGALSITTSTNMSTFAMQNQTVPALAPQSVECDGTNFAVGLSGAAAGSIYYSANGNQWKRKNVVSGGGATKVRYGGGTWVCINQSGTTSNSVSTASTPGGTWTARTTGIAAPYDILYTGVKWVLTNNSTTVQRSSDAITWANSGTALGASPSSGNPIFYDNGILCIPSSASGNFSVSNDDAATFTAVSSSTGGNDNNAVSFTYTGTGYLYATRYGSAYSANGTTGWASNSTAMLTALGSLVATAANQMPMYFRIGSRVFAILYTGATAFTPDFAYSDDNLVTWYGGNWSSAAPTVGVVMNNLQKGVEVDNGYLYAIIGTIQISVGPAAPIVPTSVYIYQGSAIAPLTGTAGRSNWYGRVK
jgi:hypothetical protein